jgi:hypothetical protein
MRVRDAAAKSACAQAAVSSSLDVRDYAAGYDIPNMICLRPNDEFYLLGRVPNPK